MIPFLLKHLKFILVGALVVALFTAGVVVRGLYADRARLEAESEVLRESITQLSLQIANERAAMEAAQEVARLAELRAGTARKGISDARRTDPAAAEWADTPLPAAIADSLR